LKLAAVISVSMSFDICALV